MGTVDSAGEAAGGRRTGGRVNPSRLLTQALRPWGLTALLAIAALIATSFAHPRPVLVWNASPSSPVGLYAVTAPDGVKAGDLVVAWAPPAARRLAAARLYLPLRVPLVKGVAAIAGDRVCARGARIVIDGRLAAVRLRHDPEGRPMPWWRGCQRLEAEQMFLLSAAGPLAFDGRYFGVTNVRDLVGKARLLWPKQ